MPTGIAGGEGGEAKGSAGGAGGGQPRPSRGNTGAKQKPPSCTSSPPCLPPTTTVSWLGALLPAPCSPILKPTTPEYQPLGMSVLIALTSKVVVTFDVTLRNPYCTPDGDITPVTMSCTLPADGYVMTSVAPTTPTPSRNALSTPVPSGMNSPSRSRNVR